MTDKKALMRSIASKKGKEYELLSYAELLKLSDKTQCFEVKEDGMNFAVEIQVDSPNNEKLLVCVTVGSKKVFEVQEGYMFIKHLDGTIEPYRGKE